MRVQIDMIDGEPVTIENMPHGDVFDLLENFREGSNPVISVSLDEHVAHIARRHITMIQAEVVEES